MTHLSVEGDRRVTHLREAHVMSHLMSTHDTSQADTTHVTTSLQDNQHPHKAFAHLKTGFARLHNYVFPPVSPILTEKRLGI
jgi:hypothetical protein